MKENNIIIFVGELPSTIIHGVSVSNKINIDILSEMFKIIIIEEKSKIRHHAKFHFSKITNIFYYTFQIIKIRTKYRNTRYLYMSLSISRFGLFKNIFISFFYKLLYKNSKIILHNYRGDFSIFYNKNKINKILIKFLNYFIFKIIILSNSMIEAEHNILFFDKFVILPNCVPHHLISKNISLPNQTMIYISHFIESKGIFDLLEALVILEDRNVDFNINLYGQFKNKEDRNNIFKYKSNKIIINEFLDEKDKLKKLSECSCLILPSHNEGQPQIILEAMSIGIPIIATDVGDIINMLGKEYKYIVKKKSPHDLANVIKLFLDSSKIEKNHISDYLKSRYNKYYSFEIHKNKLINLFNYKL